MSGLHLRDRIAASPVTGAWFSDEEPAIHRYALWRIWGETLPLLLIGALNPSTADHEKNDPTITRDIGFAKRDGFGGIVKVNAQAYRSTDPKGLKKAHDPMGPQNKRAWREAAELCPVALIAYGTLAGGVGLRMAQAIADAGSRLVCLGLTKDGHPNPPRASAVATPVFANVQRQTAASILIVSRNGVRDLHRDASLFRGKIELQSGDGRLQGGDPRPHFLFAHFGFSLPQ